MKVPPTKSLWIHLECWINLENKGKKQLGFSPARDHDILPSPVTPLNFLHLLLEYLLPVWPQVKWGWWQKSILLWGSWFTQGRVLTEESGLSHISAERKWDFRERTVSKGSVFRVRQAWALNFEAWKTKVPILPLQETHFLTVAFPNSLEERARGRTIEGTASKIHPVSAHFSPAMISPGFTVIFLLSCCSYHWSPTSTFATPSPHPQINFSCSSQDNHFKK